MTGTGGSHIVHPWDEKQHSQSVGIHKWKHLLWNNYAVISSCLEFSCDCFSRCTGMKKSTCAHVSPQHWWWVLAQTSSSSSLSSLSPHRHMVILLGVWCNILNISVTMETFTAKHVHLIKHNIKLYREGASLFFCLFLFLFIPQCWHGAVSQTQIYYRMRLFTTSESLLPFENGNRD